MEQEDKIISYLTFSIGDEVFAVHVNYVQTIMNVVEITRIPDSPEYMPGVINLRGQVLPVIDTHIKLNMGADKKTKDSSIIVLELVFQGTIMLLGILVDSVNEVLEIEDEHINPPPSIGNYYKSEFVTGMIEHENKFIMLLNADKIFSTKDLINLQATSEAYEADENDADIETEQNENEDTHVEENN